ncbi:MAG: hypothetical protein KDB14_30255 [Planctomycetales bacterium]|nr:hypothetical protein [Planctomycetales bacterium]
MMFDIGSIAGGLLVVVVCGWAVFSLASQLLSNIGTGKAVDSTLSEVDRRDAPGLYALQLLGFILLIGASAAIGIGVAIVFVHEIMNY